MTSGVLRRLGNNLANQRKASPSSRCSLTALSVKWFHTCCYWMSTKRLYVFGLECPWHNYSILLLWHTLFFFTPFFLRQSKDQQCYSPCTWFLNMMPAEPGALIKYENTNLHLLSVWRGSPYRNKGLGFPKPKLEVQKRNENLILTPNQYILYNNQPLIADKLFAMST